MPKTEPNCLIRFGVFEVDPRTGELRSKGSRVKLQDQPLQILLALLEKPGEVVTREELRAKLWPTDTFVDFDHGLNAAVKRLRDALDDSAESPHFIETLPRRGYRFISTIVADTMNPEQHWSLPKKWVLPLAVAVLALIALAVLAMDIGGQRSRFFSRSFAQPQIHSLAVLPLTNMSGDPEQEYFADGMTEELITELSQIGSLRVISRTSVMRYKGEKKKPLAQIGRELNVDAEMEGSVLRAGNRVRIAAHMIYAPTDENVMAETYERDLGDVLKLQSEVAQAIAQQVRIQLTPEQQARLHSAPVVNPRAYEAYLKGRFYIDETQAAIRQAQSYFEEAVREDPSFALAYVGLADCYLVLGEFRWMPPQDANRHASEAVHKALQLDESLGEAHSTLGDLNWRYDWDWQAAEREFRHAIDLSPNNVEGHGALVWYLAWSGRRDAALAEVQKIRTLDPADPFTSLNESGVYYHQRDYKSLIEASQRWVITNPNAWSGHYYLAVGYEGSGQREQAVPEYQRSVDLSQRDSDATAGLAHVYATMGKRAEAEKILGDLLRQSKTTYVSPYMIAAIYSGLGQNDKAFEFLEKAYQEKSPDIPYFIKADLRIDTLRSDPRFEDLLRRIGLPQ